MKNNIQYNLKEVSVNPFGFSAKLIENSWTEDKSNLFCFPAHWHDCYELLLVVSGSLIIRINNISLELFENQIAVFSPGDIHSGTTGEYGCAYKCLQFDLDNLLDNSDVEKSLKSNLKAQHIKINHCIKEEFATDLFNQTVNSCLKECISQSLNVKSDICAETEDIMQPNDELHFGKVGCETMAKFIAGEICKYKNQI